jgi:hypothetical protein
MRARGDLWLGGAPALPSRVPASGAAVERASAGLCRAHERIAAELKLGYYFAHPHAAWERGANENLNGLLRQFFPKHRKLEEVSDEEIALAQHRLNHRPRKCLGYKTPHQVFWEQLHSNQPVALRC